MMAEGSRRRTSPKRVDSAFAGCANVSSRSGARCRSSNRRWGGSPSRSACRSPSAWKLNSTLPVMDAPQRDANPVTVVLADDHAIVRMGFRLLLETAGQCRVIGEAESGEEACSLYFKLKPDVLVMDIAMPGMHGLEALNRVLARDAGARILVLSAHEDMSYPRRAIQAGALGYLSKRG